MARARALWRLAHVYEAENYLVSARDAYLQTQARYPRIKLPELGTDVRWANWFRPSSPAARWPRSPRPSPAAGAAAAGAAMAYPVASRALPGFWLPRDASGAAVEPCFAVEGTVLTPLDPATGERRWTVDLGSPPAWVGYLSDKVVAASAQRVVGLDPATGEEQWRFARQPAAAPNARSLRPGRTRGRPEKARAAFHDFHPVGARLFCLRGDQELIAIDGETGPSTGRSPRRTARSTRSSGSARSVASCRFRTPIGCWCWRPKTGGRSRGLLADGESLSAPVPIDEDHVCLWPTGAR